MRPPVVSRAAWKQELRPNTEARTAGVMIIRNISDFSIKCKDCTLFHPDCRELSSRRLFRRKKHFLVANTR